MKSHDRGLSPKDDREKLEVFVMNAWTRISRHPKHQIIANHKLSQTSPSLLVGCLVDVWLPVATQPHSASASTASHCRKDRFSPRTQIAETDLKGKIRAAGVESQPSWTPQTHQNPTSQNMRKTGKKYQQTETSGILLVLNLLLCEIAKH